MSIFEIDVKKKQTRSFVSNIFWSIWVVFGVLKRKFWNLDGLYTTVVGYAGGHTINPNYETVCESNKWSCRGCKSNL